MKSVERLASQGQELNAEDSTMSRAFAARANYLSLEKPDSSFSTNELCRDVSLPTRGPVQNPNAR